MNQLQKEFKKYVRTIVPERSLLVVQVPEQSVQQMSHQLSPFNMILEALSIRMLIVPDTFKLTVVPGKPNQETQVEFLEPTKNETEEKTA